MSVVIDASVALKWVLNEPGAEAADALRAERLIAPSLWLVEAANALWRNVSRGDLSAEEAQVRLTLLRTAPVHAERSLWKPTWQRRWIWRLSFATRSMIVSTSPWRYARTRQSSPPTVGFMAL